MVLPIALGVLAVLSLTVVAVVDYSSGNARNATRSKGEKAAMALAEAGINNAIAVLAKEGANNLDQSLLPACTLPEDQWKLNDGATPPSPYEGGDARWCATWVAGKSEWHVSGLGIVRNPYGTGATRRKVGAVVPITPIYTQALANGAWNYMFATRTGTPSGCDLTFSNNVVIGTNVYAMGNLCLDQNVAISSPKIIVRGKIDVENNARIGQSGTNNWSTRVEVQVGGSGGQYCAYAQYHWHTASNGDGHPFCGDADHVYSRNAAQNAMTVSSTPQNLTPPTVEWDAWYQNAIPGPTQDCTTKVGTVPVFDTNTTRDWQTNGSVPTVFELTPATSSYTCRVGQENGPLGELSWNHVTKRLIAKGTIFIDGSVRITNTAVNSYDGYSTLYVSGTFLMDNGAKMCAVVNSAGDDCDYAGWDPNTRLMTVVAGGSGALAGAGSQTSHTNDGGPNSILLSNNVRFQGALHAGYAIQLVNNSKVDGPMIGTTVVVDNNVMPDAFPTITTAPSGMPGNPIAFGTTAPPQKFTG